MPRCLPVRFLALFVALCPATAAAQDARPRPLVLVDQKGKEMTLENWTLAGGGKQIDWLGKEAAAATWLEFREHKTPMYQRDVTTFIPLQTLKRIDYDLKAKEASITLVGQDGKDLTLRGPTKYVDINQLQFDGELALGGKVSVSEGFIKVGVQSIRFAGAKAMPLPETAGVPAALLLRTKDKTFHETRDLAPLYRTKAGHRVASVLMFQKTIRIDTATIARMAHVPPKDKKGGTMDFEVERRDGGKETLSLLEAVDLDDKEAATLVGLIGRVPAGYRLFPFSVISEVVWKSR